MWRMRTSLRGSLSMFDRVWPGRAAPRVRHVEVEIATLETGDHGVWFHHGIGLAGRLEGVLPDKVRLLHDPVDLAHVDMNMDVDVVLVLVMDLWCTVLHGLHGVVNGREGLIVHLDTGEGLHCRLLVDGSHRRDVLADVPHLVGVEHGMVLSIPENTPLYTIGVEAADGGLDAWHLEGLRNIDAHDLRVGIRAPQDLCHEHPRKRKVGRIARLACHLRQGIASNNPFAYDIEIVLH